MLKKLYIGQKNKKLKAKVVRILKIKKLILNKECGGNYKGGKGDYFIKLGCEVLIKSMIQAILTFVMGCFELPLGLCHEIEALIKKFW